MVATVVFAIVLQEAVSAVLADEHLRQTLLGFAFGASLRCIVWSARNLQSSFLASLVFIQPQAAESFLLDTRIFAERRQDLAADQIRDGVEMLHVLPGRSSYRCARNSCSNGGHVRVGLLVSAQHRAATSNFT
ncbi:hypothetical protein GE09DRAFT_599794 [Coniochaeta sp. 2T2.1]|nr:hypothetical protein GE09DRAFT_599794 [Coniochaeta sp. 2T2.1]